MSSIPFIVDCHLHAHWPQRYAYSHPTGSRIEVSDIGLSAEALFPTLSKHGVTHTLIIQPGAYGNDNQAMLDAIAGSKGRAKGMAGMALDASDEVFADLKRQGVVGTRLSLITADSRFFERLEIGDFLARCKKHDFFVEVFAASATWPSIMPLLADSGVRVIVEHVAWPITSQTLDQPGFQDVLRYGRTSDAIIKVVSGFRLTQEGRPYEDVKPFVMAAIEAFGPDRCIWGSDWPFLNPNNGPIKRPYPGTVEYSGELAPMMQWVPDDARRKILWETPARLFGFQEADAPSTH